MPRERADWIAAMHAEVAPLPPAAARAWAFGCVVAAVKQRLVPMKIGNLRVPRWVMLIEALGSFVPITHSWFAITFDEPGLLRHPWRIVVDNYVSFPGGTYVLSMLLAACVVGLLGPIGLFLGLRYVVTGRGIEHRAIGYALIGMPLAMAVYGVIAGYLVGPPDFALFWSPTIVLGLLPLVCVAHLMYLARRDGGPLTTASA